MISRQPLRRHIRALPGCRVTSPATFFVRSLLSLLLVLLAATEASAQPIALELGEREQQVVPVGGTTRVPVIVRVPPGDLEGLAAFQVAIRWDTAALVYDSLRIVRGNALTVTTNDATAGSGLLRFSAFTPDALTVSGAVLELFYTLSSPRGSTSLTIDVEAAGDVMGRRVLERVRSRGVALCAVRCDGGY